MRLGRTYPPPKKTPPSSLHMLSLCTRAVLGLEREEERETERVSVCKVSTHSHEIISDEEESDNHKYHMILLTCDI